MTSIFAGFCILQLPLNGTEEVVANENNSFADFANGILPNPTICCQSSIHFHFISPKNVIIEFTNEHTRMNGLILAMNAINHFDDKTIFGITS
jgi:hypothetical protein